MVFKSIALVIGPVIVGALFFLADASRQSPGVYAETPAGIYQLTGFSESRSDDIDPAVPSFSGIERRAPILLGELVYSFFVVRSRPDSGAGLEFGLESIELLFIALDYRTGRQRDHSSLPLHIRDVSEGVSRVTSPELEARALHDRYMRAITRTPSLPATVETYVGLVIPGVAGKGRCIYPVRVGPRAPLAPFPAPVKLLPTSRP